MYCTIAPIPTPDLINHSNLTGKIQNQTVSEARQENHYLPANISSRLCAQASYAVLGVPGYASTIPGYGTALQNYVGNMCSGFTNSSNGDSGCYVERRTRADRKTNTQHQPKPGFAYKTSGSSAPTPVKVNVRSSSSGRDSSPSSSTGSVIINQVQPLNPPNQKDEISAEKILRPNCRYAASKKTVDQSVQSQYLNWKNSRPWADQSAQNSTIEAQNIQSKIYRFQKTISSALNVKPGRHVPKTDAMEIDQISNKTNHLDQLKPYNPVDNTSRVKPTIPPKGSRIPEEYVTKFESVATPESCHGREASKQSRCPGETKQNRQTNNTNVQAKSWQKSTKESDKKKSFLEMYEVHGVIGVGGGGMVYSGVRLADSQPVAIKRIMREKVKRWEKIYGRSVPQEIGLMIRVNGHRGIIKLIDWYECLDSFILVLERPKNSIDLFDYIREVGRMTEEEACMIFRQVVASVHHIHTRGVVHRDIKDENIVLNRDTGESKLIDFGCGTLLHDDQYRDFSGTPEFYPPEWFNQHQYKARTAAVWSLGVLLFDMLCGEIPFKTKQKIGQGRFDFKVPLSSEAKHLVSWMLSVNPDSRPNLIEIFQHPWISTRR